jgi:hypothetical protein
MLDRASALALNRGARLLGSGPGVMSFSSTIRRRARSGPKATLSVLSASPLQFPNYAYQQDKEVGWQRKD